MSPDPAVNRPEASRGPEPAKIGLVENRFTLNGGNLRALTQPIRATTPLARVRCQGRSKTRPVWRSKSRPVDKCVVVVGWGIEGPLERSERGSSIPQRLAGWMTFFGATVLMAVSLIEITFYISALSPDPALMPSISLRLISAVQHLYFIVAAPTLFLPLGIILISPGYSHDCLDIWRSH
jgi:hypothetical protein